MLGLYVEAFNIECKKELTIDGKKELIDYGQDLENELIEYYSNALVQEYGIEINKIDGLFLGKNKINCKMYLSI